MIYVRALWGDPTVCTYAKSLWDIKHRSTSLPESCDLRIVAYGVRNADFLDGLGYERNIIYRADILPDEYDKLNPNRPKPVSKRRANTVVDGVMMWWHKLAAIRCAIASQKDYKTADCIWLDWDTQVLKEPDDELYDMLRAGSPLQGCECPWKTPRAPWRERSRIKWGYHGGAYYVRGLALMQRAIELHAELFPLYSDETVMCYLADHDLAGQECENTRFCRCRKVKPGTDVSQAYFMEGNVMHWKEAMK